MTLIAGLVLLSAALYAWKLGFYSDDWAILSFLNANSDQSLLGLLRIACETFPYRPGQAANLAILYWLFGLVPVGFHLVNALVLAAIGPLLYLVLRECGQSRLIAVAVPLVFLCLPHYATNRFWYASFAVPVCTVFYLFSLYADLRVVRPGRLHRFTWKSLAVGVLLASILTYEVWLPMFFLSPLLVWYRSRQQLTAATTPAPGLSMRSAVWLGIPTILAILAVTAFKLLLTTRLKSATVAEHFTWFWGLLRDAVLTTLAGDFGLRLPATLMQIASYYPQASIAWLSILCGVVVLGALLRADGRSGGADLRPQSMLALAAFGVFLFFAGYAIFLASFNAAVSSTGANNRSAIASSAGLAFVIVGLTGWVSSLLRPGRGRVVVFTGALAVVCAIGVLIINTVATFWIAASQRQQQVLGILQERVPELPPGTSLLLDGVCPYVGPAPVFETWWDTTGMLRILYNDPSLAGDVVTRKVSLREDGVYTQIYGDLQGPYPYEKLLVFNVQRGRLDPLPGPFAARRYFDLNNPTGEGNCRPSAEGVGEALFLPGAPPVSRAPLAVAVTAP